LCKFFSKFKLKIKCIEKNYLVLDTNTDYKNTNNYTINTNSLNKE